MSKINSNQSLPLRVINTLACWQDKRFLWALMVFVCVALVFVAHFVFQEYAFMRPCEQCVYIRYAFLVMALGGIIALIKPQNTILKLIAYALAFFGAVRGVMFSVKLNGIHHAAHSEDAIFGVQGCSTVPSFDFGLPLDKWFPSLFAPTGDCGLTTLHRLAIWCLKAFKNGSWSFTLMAGISCQARNLAIWLSAAYSPLRCALWL